LIVDFLKKEGERGGGGYYFLKAKGGFWGKKFLKTF